MQFVRNALWNFLRCSSCDGTGWVRGHECDVCCGDGLDTFTGSGIVIFGLMASVAVVCLAAWGGWDLAAWLFHRAGQ